MLSNGGVGKFRTKDIQILSTERNIVPNTVMKTTQVTHGVKSKLFNSLDSDDTLRRGISRPVNLHLSRRYVTDCVDVATTSTNHTAHSVRRHQQPLRPKHNHQHIFN